MSTPTTVLQGSSGTSSQCSASSVYNDNFLASKAWNGVSESGEVFECWESSYENPPSTDGSCYIEWNFGTPEHISHIRMCRRTDCSVENFPKDIVVYGSDTGAFSGEETLLGNVQNNDADFNSWGNWLSLTPGVYQYIRVEIHTMWASGTSADWVAVQEVEFGQNTLLSGASRFNAHALNTVSISGTNRNPPVSSGVRLLSDSDPIFSRVQGRYPSSYVIHIGCPVPNATIYYTTDGSTPTELSSIYTDPIPVFNGTLKAIAVVDDE